MSNKVAVTTSSFAQYDKRPLELLKAEMFECILNPYGRKLNKEEVIDLCRDASVIIAGTEPLDADVLRQLACLKVISRCGTGLDNVDMDAAEKLGIKVFNTPDAATLAVAELAVGFILTLLRQVNKMDFAMRGNKWNKIMGNLLYEKRVGIIGFGRIGKKVAALLGPFNCEIVYTDPFEEDGLMGLKRLPMDELLAWADVVSIHASAKEKLLREKDLRMMKKGAWLVNVSRGGVVDEDALYSALKDGHIAGAALDVFTQEPYNGCLKELDNIILTPHVGSYAKEARIKMEMQAVENFLSALKGEMLCQKE